MDSFLDLTMDVVNEFLWRDEGIVKNYFVSFLPDVLGEKAREECRNQIESLRNERCKVPMSDRREDIPSYAI